MKIDRDVGVACGRQLLHGKTGQELAQLELEHGRQTNECVHCRVAMTPVDTGVIRHIKTGEQRHGLLIESQREAARTETETEQSGRF